MTLLFSDAYYEGYIRAGGKRFFLKAHCPGASKWKPEELVVDWRLCSLLKGSLIDFIKENSCTDFMEFFNRLNTFVQSNIQENVGRDLWRDHPVKAHNLYKTLMKELNECEKYIDNVNMEELIIHIKILDKTFIHKSVIKLSENYPKDLITVISHTLPINENNSHLENNIFETNTISTYCRRYIYYIDHFHTFWKYISVLDSKCWIVDPEKPTTKDTSRRIKLSSRVYVILNFNPFLGEHRPEIKFVGCDSTVKSFRDVLQKNLENDVWNPENDLLSNLTDLLEVSFPSKETSKVEKDNEILVQEGECCICFMFKYENNMPDIICENNDCLANYHESCLYNYLISVRYAISFEQIQGYCPKCNECISCPLQDMS